MGSASGHANRILRPALEILTAFGLNAQQQNAWLYEGGGLAKLQELYAAKFNVIQFPAGNTGVQMGGWFRREINTVQDLQGLKMRIPGLGGQVMAKLGVTVQQLPGGEIFQVLDTGTIDAADGGPSEAGAEGSALGPLGEQSVLVALRTCAIAAL